MEQVPKFFSSGFQCFQSSERRVRNSKIPLAYLLLSLTQNGDLIDLRIPLKIESPKLLR